MTDKVQKIREEVERIINRRLNLLNGDYFDLNKEADGFTNEIMDIIDPLQEEHVSEKKCMFTKDSYTDEDRKILCEDCKEKCEFNKKEPINEELGEYINKLSEQFPEVSFAKLSRIAVRVAKWQKEQFEKDYTDLCNGIATAKGLAVTMAHDKGMADAKEQMMEKAIDVEVKVDAGGYPYIPQMELYDYDKDVPLVKEGDRYKVILIKES